MPDTRPGIQFNEYGVCYPCINFEKTKNTDWVQRKKELEKLCDKHRECNGNNYDCVIAVSGGKDSHFQVYYMKEVMKMNPLLVSSGNFEWTETGRKNLENLSESFGCDILLFQPNRKLAKKVLKKAFEDFGSPSWYLDYFLYALPYRMALKMGIKLLVYGEDVNYTYGGIQSEEKASAMLQSENDVVKPIPNKWFEDGEITKKELDGITQPTRKECEDAGLEPIYLSYYIPWNSHHNFQVAQKWGFRHLGHEHEREGSLDNYDQIDSLSYMLNPYLKYLKFGHASATDIGSKWIRYGMKTREEMIPIIEERDGKLDQDIVERFCEFTGLNIIEFWKIMDKWYNKDLFEQDNDGIWHPKFKVGTGLIK
jgi:N-acetyl sugar amidotransferase|tara:strand:- start:332 stop:1432 length:1101 start_codon:yes stop_codon:yes gene_type:complete